MRNMESAAIMSQQNNHQISPLHAASVAAATAASVDADLSPTAEQKRHVRFPSDDVVTNYIDPPDLWPRDITIPSSQDLLRRYVDACVRYNTRPLPKLTDQLLAVDLASQRWAPALSLRGEKLDPPQVESMEEILRWVRFRIFDISDTMLDDESATALFDMLEFYDGVENLNISGQKQLTERGWSACARLIRRAASLQALYIRHCNLDSQALRHIGRALQLGGFLSEIHLERSSIGGAGLAHLVAGARTSTTLRRLHLSGCRLTPSDGTHLGILLRQSRFLETLDVEDNMLQDSGCMQVLSGLAANRDTRLTDLRLGTNQLTAQVANAIAYALVSAPIHSLSLSRNNIGTEGILGMRDGMLRCSLQHLDLSETRLSCEAAIALAEIAVESRTLTSMDLRGNPIRTAGIMALGLAARMNQHITSIEIDRNRPVTKGGSDSGAVLEELLSLTIELDRQLATNRHLLEQKNADESEDHNIPARDVDSDSVTESNGLKHNHSSSEEPAKSPPSDPIETFFGSDEELNANKVSHSEPESKVENENPEASCSSTAPLNGIDEHKEVVNPVDSNSPSSDLSENAQDAAQDEQPLKDDGLLDSNSDSTHSSNPTSAEGLITDSLENVKESILDNNSSPTSDEINTSAVDSTTEKREEAKGDSASTDENSQVSLENPEEIGDNPEICPDESDSVVDNQLESNNS